jgi:cell division protein FtsZ
LAGGGNNAVRQMIENKVKNVEFYFLNTEKGILNRANTINVLQIGKETTKGLGAGANPDVGEKSAIESKEEIKEILQGTDLLFLTSGMGGGTGTGAIPVVAELAKEMGITTIGIVTSPFLFEGKQRAIRAKKGIEKLKNNVNSLIIISNDKLLKTTNNKISIKNAFKLADDVIEQGIKSITDIITSIGDVNVDFADIITILQYKGMAYMAIGQASGEHRMEDAVKQAINNPLTENTIKDAKGIIFNVRANSNLELNELNDGMNIVNDLISEDANVIFGTTVDETLGDEIIVTVIATGVAEQ